MNNETKLLLLGAGALGLGYILFQKEIKPIFHTTNQTLELIPRAGNLIIRPIETWQNWVFNLPSDIKGLGDPDEWWS